MKNRVVGLRFVKASELAPDPRNWRLHPEVQRGALRGILESVGFVGAVIARECADGKLQIIDGHLRAEEMKAAEVPVLVVDLNEEEAAQVLATFDPLSAMAERNDQALSELLGEIGEALDFSADLRAMVAAMTDELQKQEAQKTKSDEREVDGMGLRPHEHYDYLVVMASTTHEWNVLCDKLNLLPQPRRGRMGTCRALRAAALLEKLGGSNA